MAERGAVSFSTISVSMAYLNLLGGKRHRAQHCSDR
jgi:hypothetical protein